MSDTCSGHCCKNFSLPLSPEELWDAYHRSVATQKGNTKQMTKEGVRSGVVHTDIQLIATMVTYLGPEAKSPKYVNDHEKGPDVHRYKCKHWDPKTKLCTIYEVRPQMCRDFPAIDGCNYAMCTWEERKRKKTKPFQSITAGPPTGTLGEAIEKLEEYRK